MARMAYLNLGSTPGDEPCTQIGDDGYAVKAKGECRRYIEQLIKQFGHPPGQAYFAPKGFSHDFGTYYEVVIWYTEDNQEEINYAFNVENNLPARWV